MFLPPALTLGQSGPITTMAITLRQGGVAKRLRPAPNQPGNLGRWPSAWQLGRPPPHEEGRGGQLLMVGLLGDLACRGVQDAQDLKGF